MRPYWEWCNSKTSIKVYRGSSTTIYKVLGKGSHFSYNGHSIMRNWDDKPVEILEEL